MSSKAVVLALVAVAAFAAPTSSRAGLVVDPDACGVATTCPVVRPVLAAPAGWRFDAEAARRHALTVLVPNGMRFGIASVSIYARASRAHPSQDLAAFIATSQTRWRASVPEARITELPAIRVGGRAYRLFRYENPGRPAQPMELGAFSEETGPDGALYRVMIMLSARDPAALRQAEPTFRALLAAR